MKKKIELCAWYRSHTDMKGKQTRPPYCAKRKCNGRDKSCQMYFVRGR